ncbi:hypothetical protein N8D56_17050 [Devosia sp. A8/3-2]|nr:hypothetical protein N8D56_17050 [Devosia sp. A8/3-2]
MVMDAGAAPGESMRPSWCPERIGSSESRRDDLPEVDAARWKPRRPARLVDEGTGPEAVAVFRVGPGATLVDAVGEPPLLLVTDELPVLGRWAGDAVVVLLGDGAKLSGLGGTLLEASAPKLLVLGGSEADIDMAVAALRDQLDGTGLVALEPAMALEV